MSFYRFSHIILCITLLIVGVFFYVNHKKNTQIIETLRSYKIQDDLHLIQSPYGFPALSADAAPNSEYDPALPILLKKCLPNEGHILHVGGLSGIHTLLINQLYPKLKITATEGQPLYRGLFEKNIKVWEKTSIIKLYNMNPSNRRHTIKVCRDDEGTTECGDLTSAEKCSKIQEIPLDTVSLPSLSFIVIESHLEANKVIQGLRETLKKSGYPPILLFPNVVFGKSQNDTLQHIMREGKYMVYKVAVDVPYKRLTVQQIDEQRIHKDEPCFILMTPELMPITL